MGPLLGPMGGVSLRDLHAWRATVAWLPKRKLRYSYKKKEEWVPGRQKTA